MLQIISHPHTHYKVHSVTQDEYNMFVCKHTRAMFHAGLDTIIQARMKHLQDVCK